MSGISKEVKSKILNSVKNEGIAVSKLSEEYGISTVTIYTWMRRVGRNRKLAKNNPGVKF